MSHFHELRCRFKWWLKLVFPASLGSSPTTPTPTPPATLAHLPSLKSHGLSNPSFLCLPQPHLSLSVMLSLQLFCFMNLYSVFKAQMRIFSLQCLLWSPQESITSSLGLLRYFVHICVTYLTLYFAWLCTFLFSCKGVQGPCLVYSRSGHTASDQRCLLN